MTSLLTSFDGATGTVFDQVGRPVARFALDDQRAHGADPVLTVFEDRDPTWESRLLAWDGRSPLIVTMVLHSGMRMEGVRITACVEVGRTLDGSMYALEHEDF